MKKQIVSTINSALKDFVDEKIKEYGLNKTCPILSKSIREFILRDGKRIRPLFFLLSYLGYARSKKLNSSVLRASLSFELLHDFLLVHDDIIDNSNTRRGKPTMHKVFQSALRLDTKTSQDLSIIAGDIIFAMALDAFLDNKLAEKNKQLASKIFLKATVLTGVGEIKDVLNGLTSMEKIGLKEIFLNYCLKTAEYTFKAPLVCGAVLAGAPLQETKKMETYGQLLGQAFQIQDDLIGIFGKSKQIGKSVLSDIIEAKKTYPLYLAYCHCTPSERKIIKSNLGNKNLTYGKLQKIRKIILKSGAQRKTIKKIAQLLRQAELVLNKLNLSPRNKQLLKEYTISYISV